MADLTFTNDIKPLFREKDRKSMLRRFDLWAFPDVLDHAPAILGALQRGSMPCDGPWSPGDVDIFQRWVAGGMAE
jgi:hypothetical protein